MTNTEVLGLCSTIIGLLLGGNIYFVKQMFDKVNATSSAQTQQGLAISTIGISMNDIKSDMREFRSDLKLIRTLEKDVAVMQAKFDFNPQFSGQNNKG